MHQIEKNPRVRSLQSKHFDKKSAPEQQQINETESIGLNVQMAVKRRGTSQKLFLCFQSEWPSG